MTAEIVRTRGQYANAIRTLCATAARSAVEVGALLIAAKKALPRGEWTGLVESDLPFGERTARMLMAIARHPALQRNHGSGALPASWRTLYELSRLPVPVVEERLASGAITPELERAEVAKWRPASTPEPVASPPAPEAAHSPRHDLFAQADLSDKEVVRRAAAAALEAVGRSTPVPCGPRALQLLEMLRQAIREAADELEGGCA